MLGLAVAIIEFNMYISSRNLLFAAIMRYTKRLGIFRNAAAHLNSIGKLVRYHTRNSIFTAFIELQVPGVYVHRVQQGMCPPPPVCIKFLKCCLDGFFGNININLCFAKKCRRHLILELLRKWSR